MQLERETQAREVTGLTDEEWMDQRAPALEAVVASRRYRGFAALVTGRPDRHARRARTDGLTADPGRT